MEEPAFPNKFFTLPFVTEWHINLHKMLSLINAKRKMPASSLIPEERRPTE
jgi:hypothetical protein